MSESKMTFSTRTMGYAIEVGDLVQINGGERLVVTKVVSNTEFLVRPASFWVIFKFFMRRAWRSVKIMFGRL
jgi:hypothetical protein